MPKKKNNQNDTLLKWDTYKTYRVNNFLNSFNALEEFYNEVQEFRKLNEWTRQSIQTDIGYDYDGEYYLVRLHGVRSKTNEEILLEQKQQENLEKREKLEYERLKEKYGK